MKKTVRLLALIVCMVLTLMPIGSAEDFSGATVRIAQQYGMQYAPVYVMQALGILEKHLPGAAITWSNLGGGSSMNEALITNSLDIAFMGIPPMVIAWDKGVTYRIAAGICVPPAQLMMRDETIRSLADIGPTDKIAVPSIGSIQHIMLSMAAERQLGDSHALDNHIIAMTNPDAYAALISGTDIVGHFASMPYIDLEQKDGMHSILTAKEIYDKQASIICVTTEALHNNTAVYEGFMNALRESIELVNSQSDEVIKIIAETEKVSVEDAKAYLNWEGTMYSTDLYGVLGFAEFMQASGYVKNELESIEDIAWPGINSME